MHDTCASVVCEDVEARVAKVRPAEVAKGAQERSYVDMVEGGGAGRQRTKRRSDGGRKIQGNGQISRRNATPRGRSRPSTLLGATVHSHDLHEITRHLALRVLDVRL